MSLGRLQIFLWMAVFAVSGGLISAQTQTQPEIVQAVDNSVRTTLAGSVHPATRTAVDLGRLSPNQPLRRMLLVMKPSAAQQSALATLLDQQQSKGSAQFHKWLTPAQFAARFAPAPGDVETVVSWLSEEGFTNVKPAAGGQWIEFSGQVDTVENAFQTSMHRYQTTVAATGNAPASVEQHIANATELSIPQALSPVVKGVLSLNDFDSRPMHTAVVNVQRNSAGKMVPVKGQVTGTDGNGDFEYMLGPADAQTIYGATPLIASGINGSGVSIAIIGRTDIALSDVQTFRQLFNLPQNDPNFIVSGPDPGILGGGDQGESSLDVEWAGAMAPNATVNFVVAASTPTTDGIALAAAYAVDNTVSPIISLSYGSCEQFLGPSGNQFWNSMWEQAAAEGISVFVASGDSGAASCDGDARTSGPAVYGENVNGVASTPFDVAVGGTQFNEGSLAGEYWNGNNGTGFISALGYIPETAWNESCDPTLPTANGNCPYGLTSYQLTAGGGGPSNCSQGTVDANGNVTCTAGYPKPAWQVAPGVPADGVRDLPDVALNASDADDPYIICVAGFCQYTGSGAGIAITEESLVGGTSVSAPVMASIMALVEQQNGQYQGLPDYTLYKLAAAQNAANCNSSNRTDPSQPSSCVFNDITQGTNGVPGLPGYGTGDGDFTAAAGYDLATGLGSVNASNLAANWNSVSYAASTTQLTAAVTTAAHGTPVAIAVKVAATSGQGTPTGDIAISTGAYGTEGQYTLTAGSWSGKISDLPGGTYNLTARYAGDANYGSSTSTGTSITITPEASKPTLLVQMADQSGNLVPFSGSPILGTPAYFTVSVAGASGQGVPTGTVSVLDGTKVVASGPLNASATIFLSTNALGVGNHSLTVSYAGDNSFTASTSAPTKISIGKGEVVTLGFVPNGFSFVGQPTVLAAVVSGSGTTNPTGTVQFFDNGTAISGQVPLVSNGPAGQGEIQATFAYTYTTPSSYGGPQHILTIAYSGDSNYLGVAQNNTNLAYPAQVYVSTSSGAATTTTLKMTSPATLQMGQIATFVVSVTPNTPSANVPSGQVFVLGGNGTILGGATLVNGAGVDTTYMNAAGTWQLSAVYQGDSNFRTSSSPVVATLTVPKATPATSFAAISSNVLTGTQTSLNFVTTGLQINQWQNVIPTGTVTFNDSVNGGSPQALGTYQLIKENGLSVGYSLRATALPAGTNVVTAAYSGDPNFNAVSETQTIVVGSPDFAFAATPTSLQIESGTSGTTTLSLSSILGYTGSAALSCSGAPAGATCSVNPSTVSLGPAAQTATVTLATLAPSPSQTTTANNAGVWKLGGGASLAGMLLLFVPRRRRAKLYSAALAGVAFALLSSNIGCGGPSAKKPTLLSISSSNIKAASGSAVTLTADLSALQATPTGTVSFFDGNTAIATNVAIASGVASFQTSSLTVGGHLIKAVYSGDSANGPSTSITITQVITGSATLQLTATSGALTHTVSVPVTLN